MGRHRRTDPGDLRLKAGRQAEGARGIAAAVLVRVAEDGAFAAAALETELSQAARIDARDRALATELVYGVLRVAPWLDARLEPHAPRGTQKVDPRTRTELRLAAYQLYFLDRVPAFAAVSEAVSAVKAARGPGMAGFTNAVLRKLAKEAEPLRTGDRAARLEEAIVASCPEHLRRALERALGPQAVPFLAAGADVPAIGLRVELRSERETWLARLARAAPQASFTLGRVSPLAILARGAGKPQAMVGWNEGAWSVQEEGSQIVALAVGARGGERVLDACAGRGNKTSVLARAVGPKGAVDAADQNPAKLALLETELSRLRLSVHATFAVDWTVGAGGCDGLYDRVLLDAPCSGVGTVRRRPEVMLRREGTDLARLHELQTALGVRVAERVRPGGRLVYAVCSVLREEAEDVTQRLLAARPELEPAPFDVEELRAIAGDAATVRLLPQVHGTDGYFIASFRKR